MKRALILLVISLAMLFSIPTIYESYDGLLGIAMIPVALFLLMMAVRGYAKWTFKQDQQRGRT